MRWAERVWIAWDSRIDAGVWAGDEGWVDWLEDAFVGFAG